MQEAVDLTQLYRQSIISYVYRLTGSVEDAQDITQETILKYISTQTHTIQNPKAWMFKVATNLSWDFLKSAKNRREIYKGPWLPEPYIVDSYSVEEEVELDETLSMALLVIMEKLTMKEKITYILYDIFEFTHDEIADILHTSSQNSRQLSSRAKKKLYLEDRKFYPTKDEHEHLTRSFLKAVKTGDFVELKQIFSDEVIFHSDGGGKATAAQRVIQGSEAVILFIIKIISNIFKEETTNIVMKTIWFNGSLGIVMLHETKIVTSFSFEIIDKKIIGIYTLRNPDKLRYFDENMT